MTLPRRVFVGTFLITRRTVARKLLLRPEPELNQAFLYCVLLAAQRFAVRIHGFVFMSNHYHAVVTPAGRNLPRFVHWINTHMAKLVNVRRKRHDVVWSGTAKYSAVHLADASDVLDKLVYVAANPVKAGLVPTPANWPGLRTLPDHLGTVLEAERPAFLFRSEADAAREERGDDAAKLDENRARRRRHVRGAPVLPARVELELTRPPQFEDLTDEAFRALFAARLDEEVARLQAARRAAGRGFLGAEGVGSQDPEAAPGSPGCPDFDLSPTVACKDRWRRVELLEDRAQFLAEYRAAWGAFRAGDRSVRFPEHTYGPCVLYGARCHGLAPQHAGAGSRASAAA